MTSCASKTSYRVIALLLVCCLFFGFSTAPDANAELVMSTVAIAVGICALTAAGVYLVNSNHTSSSYSDFIGGKMQSYCDTYHDGADFSEVFASGVTAHSRGFTLPAIIAHNLTNFIDWFVSDNDLTVDSQKVLVSDTVWDFGTSFTAGTAKNEGTLSRIITAGTVFPIGSSIPISSSSNSTTGNFTVTFSDDGYYRGSVAGSAVLSCAPSKYAGHTVIGFGFFQKTSGNPSPFLITADGYTVAFGSGYTLKSSGLTASRSISASHRHNPYYPISDTAVVPTRPYQLNLFNTASGDSPDPELDPNDLLASAAASALALALANSLSTTMVEDLTHQEGGGEVVDPTDPDSDDSFIRNALTAISTALESFGDWISDAASDVVDAVGTLADKLAEWFGSVLEAIRALGLTISEFFSDFWDNLKESIRPNPTLPWGESLSGFGSIWHYVVEWLGYIGGFITLILSVWSSLPYAMVVPVYACIALILIFGVYRKFIS